MLSTLRHAVLTVAFASGGLSQYVLKDDYFSGNFFDHWTFFTDPDPTHGFVTYVDRSTAASLNLITDNTAGKPVYIGVDHDTVLSPTGPGRKSVRITSTETYNSGLFILDLAHMPGAACGSWPAYWLFGPDWPNHGETDIIEGIHQQTVNDMTWHTNAGCTLTTGGFSAGVLTSNCDVQAAGQNANQGCSTQSTQDGSFGDSFNAAGGGVYALEWVADRMSIWFFPRGAIPNDITAGTPDPATWAEPLSQLQGGAGCDISSHFSEHNIVFDITFCGDWAGGTWSQSSCAALAATCEAYVASTPGAFVNSYWSINSLKVYTQSGAALKTQQLVAIPKSRKPARKGKPARPSKDNKQIPLSPNGSGGSKKASHHPGKGAPKHGGAVISPAKNQAPRPSNGGSHEV